jgi:hypothetical protein
MRNRLVCGLVILGAAGAAAPSTYRVDTWPATAGAQIGPDSTGALVLGQVAPGTNLALLCTAVDHAGEVVRVTDGNTTRNSAWNSVNQEAYNYFVQVDLAQLRVVNRVVIRPVDGTEGGTDYLKGYSVQTSEDKIVFRERALDLRNQTKLIDTSFEPAIARYVRVQVKAVDNVHRVQISEVEVYGQGFLSSGTLVLSPTDLGAPRAKNFGLVFWEAQQPPDTELSLAFRTGSTSTPDDRWSDWWEPPAGPAAAVLLGLPEPRRYLQYRVTMSTDQPSATPRLTALEVAFGDPLAQDAAASVTRDDSGLTPPDSLPADQVPVGVARDFLVQVRVTMGTGSGFDALRLFLPNRGQVRRVWRGGAELVAGQDYSATGDTTTVEVRMVEPVAASCDLQVQLSSVLFDDANTFRGQLVAGGQPDNPQEIAPAAAGAMTVYTSGLLGRVLDPGRVHVAPNPFTPNGDGRGDAVHFTYDLAKLEVTRPVALGVWELSGRLVRRFEMSQKSGTHVVEWDGRDDEGRLVPPGNYVYRLEVDSDRSAHLDGVIAVCY